MRVVAHRAFVGTLASMAILFATSTTGVVSASVTPAPRQTYGQTASPTPVHMRDAHASSRHSTRSAPFLAPDRTIPATAPRRAATVPTRASGTPAAGFPVMDLHRQETLYPTDQASQPPDTQLAAGPASLAEADNDTLSVWSKTGAFVASADLNTFFSVPPTYDFSDPRVLYDLESARWFLTGMAFDKLHNSQNYIAVSETSDPTGTWDKYLLTTGAALVRDQPMTGVDTDKVVISWNDFSGSPPNTPTFSGQETYVLQKSDLLAGHGAQVAVFGPDTTRFRVVPALTLTSGTATEWLTYNEATCPSGCGPGITALGVVAITGTPQAANVVWTESDPTFAATSKPPGPRQPSGITVTDKLDDRFISAVWQNGSLWLSGNDACMPAGDSSTRSCLRLVEVATELTPSIVHDFDVGSNGIDLYFPAVMVDPGGDLFVAYTKSSPGIYPTAAAAISGAASPASFMTELILAAGQTSYLFAPNNRWGDYSAAAPDPTDPSRIWVTAEYQASAADPADWGTATAELTLPIRNSVTQASGSTPPSRGPVNQVPTASPPPR